MRNYNELSDEEVEQLERLYPVTPNRRLSQMFGVSVDAINDHFARPRGWQKDQSAIKHATHGTYHELTEREEQWIVRHYHNTRNGDILAKYGIGESQLIKVRRKYGLKKTDHFMRRMRREAVAQSVTAFREHGESERAAERARQQWAERNRKRYTVELSKNGRSRTFILARLVAMAFVPNPDPKTMTYVNHKDEDTANNRADNLEWCTHKYNCNYGTRVERIKAAQNMAVVQYTMDGRRVAEYGSMHIAAEAIGKEAGHICDCCQGNRSRAYGFFWRYKDDALYKQAVRRLKHKTESARQSYKDKHTERAQNVVQLTVDGRYIATHPSSKYAAQSAGACRPSIINCCNGRQQTAAGYRWMYEKDYKKLKRNI